MSQIDKVIFFPLLIWFALFLVVIYLCIFMYFLSFFFRTLKIRQFYFFELLKYVLYVFYFTEIFTIAFDSNFVNLFFNFSYMKNLVILIKVKSTNEILN